MNDPQDPKTPPAEPTAADELREGLGHLFAAARKVARDVEPQVNRSIEEAEEALGRIGREGEAIASDVSREVASFASRLAEKLRAAADRDDKRRDDPPPDDTR